MEKYIAFVSVILDKITIHKFAIDTEINRDTLKSIATNWVCDEVGKNKFVNTLDASTLTLADWSLKLEQSNYILIQGTHKIALHWVQIQPAGWWSSAPRKTEYRGYFAIVDAPPIITKGQDIIIASQHIKISELEEKLTSLHKERNSLREDASYAVRTKQVPVKLPSKSAFCVGYDNVIDELKNFSLGMLKKISAITEPDIIVV